MIKVVNLKKTISFLILVSTIFYIGGSGVIAQPPIQTPGLDIAMEVQKAHTPTLMKDPDIVGTAVGLGDDGEPVIKVFSDTGKAKGIPYFIEGIPVDVEVTGMIVARSHTTSKSPRPVPIGVSTGHPDITAGTIGCRVTDGNDIYALSNNHVYAVQNNASIGDSVIQPGTYDGGSSPDDDIGTLFDFEPINFSGGDNTMDAAIAESSTSELHYETPGDGYGAPDSSIYGDGDGDGTFDNIGNLIGLDVMKYGRTTLLTTGEIYAVNATINVCYASFGSSCYKLAKFVDQLVITPGTFSAGGDSGSVIVSSLNSKPVGLLFAGSDSVTIANRIDLVFYRFNVTCDNGAEAGGAGAVPVCAVDADCDDGDACNGAETCSSGVCQEGSPLICDDSNICNGTETCDPVTGCQAGTPLICDDSNVCNGTETCDPATGCQAGIHPACGLNDGCCASACDSTSDSDCPICLDKGESCVSDGDCCSNKCKGKPGSKTCK